MDQIIFNDPDDGRELARCAGTRFNTDGDISICRHRNGARLGGVIFNNYTTESIGIHSASWATDWINRDMLWVTFHYPFNQLGVKRIFGQVPETNFHAQEFNVKVGFKYVARIEGVYPHNVACMVMCLERADCRFLDVKPRGIYTNLH